MQINLIGEGKAQAKKYSMHFVLHKSLVLKFTIVANASVMFLTKVCFYLYKNVGKQHIRY